MSHAADAAEMYLAGIRGPQIAEHFGVGVTTVWRWLDAAGVKARTRCLDLDDTAIVAAYRSGESVNSLAAKFAASRSVITRRLVMAGITPRTASEAELVKWSRMATWQRERQVKVAHCSRKGLFEDDIAAMLTAAGYAVTQQLAVGPYHIDVAIESLRFAVEVCGYGPTSFIRTKGRKRTEYILDLGWHIVFLRRPPVMWQRGRVVPNFFDHAHVKEHLVAAADVASRDESVRGKYRVIPCHPHYRPVKEFDLDGLPRVL